MTAKEKVLEKYPRARAERYRYNGPGNRGYNLIWDSFGSHRKRLGEGDTASKAWADAARKIARKEQSED